MKTNEGKKIQKSKKYTKFHQASLVINYSKVRLTEEFKSSFTKGGICVPKIGYVLAFKSRKPDLKMKNALSIVLDKVLKNTYAMFQANRINKSMVYDQPKLAYRSHRVKKLAKIRVKIFKVQKSTKNEQIRNSKIGKKLPLGNVLKNVHTKFHRARSNIR